MTFKMLVAALGTAALFSIGIAQAQTPPTKAPRTPRSIECSKQADAQNIHGKERRKFLRRCKRGKAAQ